MNYRYKIDDADIVLSSEENDNVKERIKAGASIVYLRGDELAINVNFIRYIKPTDKLTDPQEAEKSKRLQLESSQRSAVTSDVFRRTKDEFYKKMGWPQT